MTLRNGDKLCASNRRRPLQLRPWPHVRDAPLVAQNHDLDIARDGASGIAARRGRAPRAALRVGDFTGAAFADGTRDACEHAGHLRFFGGEHALAGQQHTSEKPEDNRRAKQAADNRDGEDTQCRERR